MTSAGTLRRGGAHAVEPLGRGVQGRGALLTHGGDDGAHGIQRGLDVELGARQGGPQLAQRQVSTAQVDAGDDAGGGGAGGAGSHAASLGFARGPLGCRPPGDAGRHRPPRAGRRPSTQGGREGLRGLLVELGAQPVEHRGEEEAGGRGEDHVGDVGVGEPDACRASTSAWSTAARRWRPCWRTVDRAVLLGEAPRRRGARRSPPSAVGHRRRRAGTPSAPRCSRSTAGPGRPRSWRSRSVAGPCRPARRGSARSTPGRRRGGSRRRGRSWAGSPRPPAGPRSSRRPRPAAAVLAHTGDEHRTILAPRSRGENGPLGRSGVVQLGLVGGPGPPGDPPVALGQLLPRATGQARGCGRCRRRRAGRWARRRAALARNSTPALRIDDASRHAAARSAACSAATSPSRSAASSAASVEVVRSSGWAWACRSCSSCTVHSTSDEPAAAELEVRLAVGAARQPLGLHPGLEGADLADLRRRRARPRASGAGR